MAQPSVAVAEVNGVAASANGDMDHVALPAKRKRDPADEGDEDQDQDQLDAPTTAGWAPRSQKELIRSYFQVLQSVDIGDPILKRPLPDPSADDEPQPKRRKSVDPAAPTISDKVSSDAYAHLEEMASDLLAVIKASLSDLEARKSPPEEDEDKDKPDGEEGLDKDNVNDDKATTTATQIREFRKKALDLFYREKAYPRVASSADVKDEYEDPSQGDVLLSLVGFAPSERRLFSSLPTNEKLDLTDNALPHGLSFTRVMPSTPSGKPQTLGELFAPSRPLPILQPPTQPKTQAKGNTLDLYYPELTDKSKYRQNSYFSQKLSTGYYLDYSNATPASHTKTKQHERAQSLAGKKPSPRESQATEMEALFRGAFSSFAPCKDDSAALVSSGTVGRMWWQRAGQHNFQRMVEIEFYEDALDKKITPFDMAIEVDEDAIQESIDNWDDTMVDPTLAEILGTKTDEHDKEADEILEEVGGLIETLASYQRIRNLNLPNSQNRQSSDPVNGDMLANAGPQPSEEEHATYEVLKAQLALIVKTLPPYAVAKLNGDQLDDLLISTKVQIQTDQYHGTMEEDEAGMQARLRAQQQAAHANARPQSQRTTSVSGMSYGKPHPTPGNQYATPARTHSQAQQQGFRHASYSSGGYQQPQGVPSAQQPYRAPPQQNQYNRPNGYPNQYATQLAKTQTPYGHQNMSQYSNQQRMQYGNTPQQQGTPNQRFNYPQGYPQQQQQPQHPSTPGPGGYGVHTNGVPRTMSPQMNRQPYSPSPNMQQQGHRYSTPNQSMASGMNRFPSGSAQPPQHHPQQQQHHQQQQQQQQQQPHSGAPSPGLTGYHTVISEAQQQRILDQAKARVAAQERTAMFGDKISSPHSGGVSSGGGGGGSGGMDANRLAAARAGLANLQKPHSPASRNGTPTGGNAGVFPPPPQKVTPVPVPAPGAFQRKDSS